MGDGRSGSGIQACPPSNGLHVKLLDARDDAAAAVEAEPAGGHLADGLVLRPALHRDAVDRAQHARAVGTHLAVDEDGRAPLVGRDPQEARDQRLVGPLEIQWQVLVTQAGVAEQAGVINVGIEGVMLIGASAAAIMFHFNDSFLLATLVGVGTGLPSCPGPGLLWLSLCELLRRASP